MLEDFVPPYDATVIKKLQAEDAILIGKTNLDEFAMGSSTENSAMKVTKNPIDITRVPGGSSGGSAAAVGSEMVPLALGSDTGGSIRQPASFCGIVGMKPTYGLVSRFGLVAFGSSLDQIGPFSMNVEDNAYLLNIIAGEDDLDCTTKKGLEKVDYTKELGQDISGMKIGIPKEFIEEKGLDPEIKEIVLKDLDALRELGCEVEEFDDAVRVVSKADLHNTQVKTLPYPGFPTDMQPQIGVTLALCKGTSTITESIFENRFKYLSELARMGANVKVEGNAATIEGVDKFSGARVSAPDLRAGAALVIAGMAADGITIVDDIVYIQRGYERFEEKLRSLGAVIERVSTEREIQKFKLKVG